jgi:hypothetical protein
VLVAFFLVERYVPSMTAADLRAAIARLDELPRGDVRHLWTILVAVEDTCLSVFEGADAEAVEEANARASFHLDRVVEVSPFGIREAARFSGSTDAPGTGRI